jgi:hypothetical protein
MMRSGAFYRARAPPVSSLADRCLWQMMTTMRAALQVPLQAGEGLLHGFDFMAVSFPPARSPEAA